MSNEDKSKYGRSSRRAFLTQESVFLGFNDYQDGVWGDDYETKREYWQISYEWGRQIAQYCEAKEIKIDWQSVNKIPRALTNSIYGAVANDYILMA